MTSARNDSENAFLKDLEKKLWTAADKLRSNLDAANYKHIVLGLIFLKYVSDAFEEQRERILRNLTDPKHDLYLDPADYDGPDSDEYKSTLADELEIRDNYTADNIFWVPVEARWSTLRDACRIPAGQNLPFNKPGTSTPETMRSVGWLIDNAMDAIERENPKLKGVLNKDFARAQLPQEKLADLISLFSDTNFAAKEYKGAPISLHSKDILGHVFEYFLGQFALAEGKKGGQYYTPKSIVTLIVEMLQPFKGRVYDPAMGSGGFFVQSEEFVESHGGNQTGNRKNQISIYGQESNPTTWRLAAINMAIRGIEFNFGKEAADTFLNNQHPALRADYVMANPPFNLDEWWNESLAADPRWECGVPPQRNANFAWLQHMLYHLAPAGSMALLLANGSMSSNTGGEGEIRKNLIEKDYVECMVALPGQLFTNTQIPACIWFLTKDKRNGLALNKKKRDRSGEFLFIDAREIGYMKDRVLRDFTEADIARIADTFHAWQLCEKYEDVPGFCYSAKLDEIKKHDYVLTPGRYVGTPEQENDGEPFAEKMHRLTAQLKEQFAESAKLEAQIKANLKELGYEM